MFTKPSLSDLLDGVVKTAENVLLPALHGLPAADVVTGLLMALDRVEAEWPITARHLIEDNLDIEHTLRRIERMTATGAATLAMSASVGESMRGAGGNGRDQLLSVHELAEDNRRLKGALVSAIEALDLPAGPDDRARSS